MAIQSTLVACAFLIIIIRSVHAWGGVSSSFTNKDTSLHLKGLAAILIIFSHAHYYVTNLGLLRIFNSFGFIGVAFFFFCSGYGVMKQYVRNAHYLDNFFSKKIKRIYIPYIVATLIWLVLDVSINHANFEKINVVNNLLGSILLVKASLPFAWYVLAVLVWYILFEFISLLIKDSKKIVLCLISINIVWYLIGIKLSIPAFYYNETCCIVMGCVIALIEDRLHAVSVGIYCIIALLFGFSILSLHYFGSKSSVFYTISVILGSITFVVFAYMTGYKIDLSSNITMQFGRYSYELYLTQGISYAISMQANTWWPGTFWIAFLFSICISAYIVKLISSSVAKLLNRKGETLIG